MTRRALALVSLVMTLFFVLTGCEKKKPAPDTNSSSTGAAAQKPQGKVKLVIAYGSEKKTWLEEQIAEFEKQAKTTKSGRLIDIEAKAMGSGEAAQAIVSGSIKPHVYSPASGLYIPLLNNAWTQASGRNKTLCPPGEALVLSPIVVAMWKPMAEALGWPQKAIGWSDLLKVNADPKGWGALGHPEWGRFKLGHTHPEFSNSGLQAVLAEAYAGAKKTRGLTSQDLDAAATQKFISSIEQTIVHYGKSTGFFSDKMLTRGPSYLSGAVLYENLVIESYRKRAGAPFPVVAIYPTEGTFWSDHPYAVLDAEWVGAEERDAADVFLKFLKDKPAQGRALALGFRPADPSIAIGSPISPDFGVDPKEPQTLLEVPDASVLEKLLQVWQTNKKSSDIILVLDKSGSMAGKPLAEAKEGAKAFLGTLHDTDEVSLIFFDGVVYPTFGPKRLDTGRQEIDQRIYSLIADGQTALYDATAQAYDLAKKRAEKEPARIHAVVVMTDGRDEGSKLGFSDLTARLGGSSESAEVKIFTIAYGDKADTQVLGQLAEAGRGNTAKGSTDTIVSVFKDMAAFF